MSKGIKEKLIELIKKMPENSTYEDIQYEIYFLQKLEKAEKDVKKDKKKAKKKGIKKLKKKGFKSLKKIGKGLLKGD